MVSGERQTSPLTRNDCNIFTFCHRKCGTRFRSSMLTIFIILPRPLRLWILFCFMSACLFRIGFICSSRFVVYFAFSPLSLWCMTISCSSLRGLLRWTGPVVLPTSDSFFAVSTPSSSIGWSIFDFQCTAVKVMISRIGQSRSGMCGWIKVDESKPNKNPRLITKSDLS